MTKVDLKAGMTVNLVKANELDTETTVSNTDILPIADPTTGAMKKVTVGAILTPLSGGVGSAVLNTTPIAGINTYNLDGGAGTYTGFLTAAATPLVLSAGDVALPGQWQAYKPQGATYWIRRQLPVTVPDNSISTVKIVDASVTNSKLAASSVSPDKASFLSVGKNKFNINASDVALGKYVDYNNGNLTTNSLYNATGFIPVTAGQPYTLSYKNQVAYYNASQIYVSGDNSANTTLTIPVGVSFMKATVATTSWTTFQIEAGSSATSFEQYLFTLSSVTPNLIQVQNANLKDTSIAKEKINFLRTMPNKNLFNPNDSGVQLGYYVDSTNGVTGPNSLYNATGFIPVTAGQQYTMSYKNQIAWFNSSKAYISGSPNTDTNKTQTAPAGAAYLRCSVLLANYSTFQVELGATQTAYEAFFWTYYLNDGTQNIAANELTKPLLASIISNVNSSLSVGNAQIQNGAVSVGKTNFFAPGKNKFNSNDADVALGKYIDYNNGNLAINSLYNATGFIPVTAGQQITLSYKHQLAWYNASKVFVSGDNSSSGQANITLTVPAGVSFMRQGVLTTLWATFQVEYGNIATTPETYTLYLTSADSTPVLGLTSTQLQRLLSVYGTAPALVAISPKMYIPVGKEIAIYYETINKYYESYKGKTGITMAGAKITGRAAKIIPSSTGTNSVSISILDEQFNPTLTKSATIEAVSATATNVVTVANIGDSYTLRSTFINSLMASSASSGVTFVGIRNSAASTPIVNAEGRGGYSLSNYMSLSKNNTTFSPFMQPIDPYKFYGVTGYWKIVNGAGGYDWDYYPSTIKGLFKASTGYLNSPNVNDVMYDDTAAGFFVWNGSAWASISESTLSFSFNYSKYRSAWGLAKPDAVHILFGTNDFAASTEPTISTQWTSWKANLEIMIASIKLDNSNVKIVIGIPNSSGKQGESGVAFDERRKRAYWYHASMVISSYSGRESENIYVLDYHSCIDREFGFDNTDEKPFNDYTGSYRERYKADTTHLGSDGFNQMGDLYFGMIQKLRQ